MKNIVPLFLLLTTFVCAQRPNGAGGSFQNQNRPIIGNRQVKQIKTQDLAGVFYYDVKSVLKKIRAKEKNRKATISKALKDYNFKIKEIALLNADNFKALDILMKSRRDARMSSVNTDNQVDFRKKIGAILRPIRKEIKENEAILNKNLASILSEKQNKKWLKIQKKEHKKLKPQKSPNNNRTLQHRTRRVQGSGRGF